MAASSSTQQQQTVTDLSLALSSSTNSTTDEEVRTRKVFTCLFCDKKFLKPQALGGHQNAHKREKQVSLPSFSSIPVGQFPSAIAHSLKHTCHVCQSYGAGCSYSTYGHCSAAAYFPANCPVSVTETEIKTLELLNWQRGSFHQSCDGVSGDDIDNLDLTLRL